MRQVRYKICATVWARGEYQHDNDLSIKNKKAIAVEKKVCAGLREQGLSIWSSSIDSVLFICDKCDEVVAPEDNFCPNCGEQAKEKYKVKGGQGEA